MEELMKIAFPYIVSNLPATALVGILLYLRSEWNHRLLGLEAAVKKLKLRQGRMMALHVENHSEDAAGLYQENDENGK
jgi:hypothetical protein